MLIYSIYRESDAKQDDSYNSCYLPPLAYIVGGLIFVLWFINAKFYIPVHIVIVTIVNLFTLIYFIPSVVTTFKKRSDFYYDIVDNDKVVYQDKTDEEKEEELRIKQNKKEEKIRAKQEENSKILAVVAVKRMIKSQNLKKRIYMMNLNISHMDTLLNGLLIQMLLILCLKKFEENSITLLNI